MVNISALVEAMRPAQWIKNISLFAAAMLSGQLFKFNNYALIESSYAFAVFCLLSSSSYLINDIVDIKKDRLHPNKKSRPLARGDLQVSQAVIAAFILTASGLALASRINSSFFYISLLFIVLQYLYSLVFKRKAILDILGIALFFIIRAYAGELATGWHLPVWIMLTVIFLSLFIASGKRRSELLNTGTNTRSALNGYSGKLLDFYTSIFAVSTLLCYALFTWFIGDSDKPIFSGFLHEYIATYFPNWLDRKWYMVTLLPIIVGIMRYGQIIFDMEEAERPEKVLATDIPLILSIFVWGAMMFGIIYVL